jgi:hypothetical protein
MAFIQISELRFAGAELFEDAESFLNELTDEATEVMGGDLSIIEVGLPVGLPTDKSRVVSNFSYSVAHSFATASLITAPSKYYYY